MGNTAVDPGLQIRRGGEGRKGRTQSQKKLFRRFGPQFGLKIRGGGQAPWAPPLDPPLEYAIIDIKRDSRLAT